MSGSRFMQENVSADTGNPYQRRPGAQGLYDPANEHDACGVGFLVNIDGHPTHEVVARGVEVLRNLLHRGAVGGDQSTGDGAGLLLQVPDAFFRAEMERPPRGSMVWG